MNFLVPPALHVGDTYARDDWQITSFARFRSMLEPYFQSEKISVSSVKNILDVGCGNGRVTNYLSSLFPEAHVIGIDVDAQMLETAARNTHNPKISYRKLDATNLADMKNEGIVFDVVNANYVLHWLSAADQECFLANGKGLMSPDALLLIGTCQQFPKYLQFLDQRVRDLFSISAETEHFLHYHNFDEWSALLATYGYSVIGRYEGLDPHPILVSDNFEDPRNFLCSWFWGASGGKAVYGKDVSCFSRNFARDLLDFTVTHYGSDGYYDFKKGGVKTEPEQGTYPCAFLEETLLILAARN